MIKSMFVHSRNSLEYHTQFQQNGQSLYPFSDQTAKKPLPCEAAHTFIVYISLNPGPPPPPPPHLVEKSGRLHFVRDFKNWYCVHLGELTKSGFG